MAQELTKKEALFNEVKGSLFEYLVARELSLSGAGELEFQRSLDRNYLSVLSQQDRMVRQFYPEMLPFLSASSREVAVKIISHLGHPPQTARLVGKFSNSVSLSSELHEADLILGTSHGQVPLSLKLSKKNAFVNTKSGGIKSFFSQYFRFLPDSVQESFNRFVDREFLRMGHELHELHELEFTGSFETWIAKELSELPGELDEESRSVLKAYYARIADEMHQILSKAFEKSPQDFRASLPALMGFSSGSILQVIFFHNFPDTLASSIEVHAFRDVEDSLAATQIRPFGNISSVEVSVGEWALQIRVKPMNKFTTTAIKINCSVRVKRSSVS